MSRNLNLPTVGLADGVLEEVPNGRDAGRLQMGKCLDSQRGQQISEGMTTMGGLDFDLKPCSGKGGLCAFRKREGSLKSTESLQSFDVSFCRAEAVMGSVLAVPLTPTSAGAGEQVLFLSACADS